MGLFSMRHGILLFFFVMLVACNWFQDNEWVFDIEGKKITKQELEDAYEGYLFWWSLQLQASPDQLRKRIKDIDSLPNGREKDLYKQLTRQFFFHGDGRQAPLYKKLILVNLEANNSGFLEKEDVQKRITFISQFFTYNLYMQDKVDINSIEIPEQDILVRLNILRRTNPQYSTLSLIKGKEVAKQQLLIERVGTKQEAIFNGIVESYKIKHNKDIDIASIGLEKTSPNNKEKKNLAPKAKK